MSSKIEWTDEVLNVVTGCSHSGMPGCDNCYARRMANRLRGRFGYPADEPFRVTFHEDKLDKPLHWKKPRRIFVSSMGDLFHKDVRKGWLFHILDTIDRCPQHTFMLLTKRPERIMPMLYGGSPRYFSDTDYLRNLHLGVSVSTQDDADRLIPTLLQIPAAVRFVSYEPALGPVDFRPYFPTEYWCFCGYVGNDTGEDYCEKCGEEFGAGEECQHCAHDIYDSSCPECGGINEFGHWDTGPLDVRPPRLNGIIAGCESGPKRRPAKYKWFRDVKDQCVESGTPFFLKQMEFNVWGKGKKIFKMPSFLDGQVWDQLPGGD